MFYSLSIKHSAAAAAAASATAKGTKSVLQCISGYYLFLCTYSYYLLRLFHFNIYYVHYYSTVHTSNSD